MFKKLFASVVAVALAFVGLVAVASPARATGSSDASLSQLFVRGNVDQGTSGWNDTATMASFSWRQDFYDVYSASQTFQIFAQPSDPAATVRVSGGSTNNLRLDPASDSWYPSYVKAAVTVDEASSQILQLTVTAADGVTTKVITLKVSSGSRIAQPQIISNSANSLSTMGGTRGVVYLKNWTPCTTFAYNYDYVDSNGITQNRTDRMLSDYLNTDSNGISKVTLRNYGMTQTFRDARPVADFIVANDTIGSECVAYNAYAGTTAPGSIRFFNDSVTSTTMPDIISQDTVFVVNGPGMTNPYNKYGGLYFELFNPKTGNRAGLYSNEINNDSIQLRVAPDNLADEWKQDQNLELVITEWPAEGLDYPPVELYRRSVKFTPEMATSVSVTPAKGPTKGGNLVKISGHGICNGNYWAATVKIGGNAVNLENLVCNFTTTSDKVAYDGISTATFYAPPGQAGAADITVDMGYGPTTLSQKYIYGDSPTVSSITPSTVANTGGSIITLVGTNFGISGTPVVIIDGQKSPYVSRLSPTKVRAMVPSSTSLGAVAVNILSSSGGGGLTQLASLTYAAPSASPVVSRISPATGALSGGTSVVISGTGFSTSSSGVTFDGTAARITASSSTSLTVDVPAGKAAGAVSVNVASPTGLATVANGFRYVSDSGVQSVAPSTIRSTAAGNDAKVTITGTGFGSSGKIRIGSASAIDYSASAGGTTISGIAIPTSVAGLVEISILPAGSSVPFTTSITITSPKISFFGPVYGGIDYSEDDEIVFGDSDPWSNDGYGYPLAAANNGGDLMSITGTGFGTSGQIKLGNTVVQTLTYSDTSITFASPSGFAPGKYDLRVIPSNGTLIGFMADAVTVGAQAPDPLITSVSANSPLSNSAPRNHFWPGSSDSDRYTITGVGFDGTDAGASTKVYMQGYTDFWNGADTWIPVDVFSSTDTTIDVKIPRSLEVRRWDAIKVVTNQTKLVLSNAVYYDAVPPPAPTVVDENQNPGNVLTQSSFHGLCNSSPLGTYTPAVVSFQNNFAGFGSLGGVAKIGGIVIDSSAVSWAGNGNSVEIDFGQQLAIDGLWGPQTIYLTSSDQSLEVFNFSFNCAVESTVTTRINGQTTEVRVDAGDPLTPSSTLNNLIPGTSWNEPDTNYEYQTRASYLANGDSGSYTRGLPADAGEYVVRARIAGAGYDGVKYRSLTASNVPVVIVGLPLVLTPELVGGGSQIAYRGQLGDGSYGSRADIRLNLPQALTEPITSVTYQYRNHACTSGSWTTGLPKEPAYIFYSCGGDGSQIGSWDIRVKSFEMSSTGVNKAGYFLAEFPTFNLSITKTPLTIRSIEAEKTYNGDSNVVLGEVTVTGAVDGETPELDGALANSGATFDTPEAGVNKAVTLNGPLALNYEYARKYELTDTSLVITGTISKADAVLKIDTPVRSVVMGQTATIDLTLVNTDLFTGQSPLVAAAVSVPELIVTTPAVCSISGTVVTPISEGDCVIQATQAASNNYNAAVSHHNNPSLIETVTIKVYGSASEVAVIADDIKVGVGTTPYPSFTPTGLLNSDTFDGVSFDYYQGGTLLGSAPTEIGTYRIVPRDGAVTTATPIAYSSTVRYIAGSLIITPTPPVITAIAPNHGPEVGGNTVVITGSGFGALTSITLGEATLRKPAFTVNGDGTKVSFVAPRGVGGLEIVLNAGQAEASTLYAYDAPYAPVVRASDNIAEPAPPVVTSIAPASGPEYGGNTVLINGTGLAGLTSIVIGTNPIDSSSFTVNRAGTQASFVAPAGTGTQDITIVAGLFETTSSYTYQPVVAEGGGGGFQLAAPVITSVTPAFGPEAGGNTVVITGTGFGALTGITLGSKTLSEPAYSINGDGTKVTLVMPKGTGTLRISLWVGQLYSETVYTYEAAIDGGGSTPSRLVLMLELAVGAKFVGQKVAINGGGLAPSSPYSLVLRSNPIVLFSGVTDAKGDFDQKLVIPAKACLPAGKHSLELRGVLPNGKEATQTAFFSLLDKCVVGGTVAKTAAKQQTLSGFLFAFRSSVLTKDAKRSLDHLVGFIKGAKSINIYGYTETDTTSAKVKAANFKLAAARAVAVKAYLKAKGIVAKFVTVGKGGSNPVSVIDQYKNRRVEIQANF